MSSSKQKKPVHKKEEEEEEEETKEEEEEEEEEEEKTIKRKAPASKVSESSTSKKAKSSGAQITKQKDGSQFITLNDSDYLRATVRQFKSMVLIDIRKYYKDKSGEIKPGNKGISLTADQWKALKNNIETIDAMVADL